MVAFLPCFKTLLYGKKLYGVRESPGIAESREKGWGSWYESRNLNLISAKSNTQDIFKSSLFELVQLMYTFLSHFNSTSIIDLGSGRHFHLSRLWWRILDYSVPVCFIINFCVRIITAIFMINCFNKRYPSKSNNLSIWNILSRGTKRVNIL